MNNTTTTTKPARRAGQNEELPLWPISYAYDVSKYADFCIRAATEEEALAIAENLLAREILPDVMDHLAHEYDNGTTGHRVFEGSMEPSEDDEFSLIAETEGVKLPADWNTPLPKATTVSTRQLALEAFDRDCQKSVEIGAPYPVLLDETLALIRAALTE